MERIQYCFDNKNESLNIKGSVITLFFNVITVIIGILHIVTYIKINTLITNGNVTGNVISAYTIKIDNYQTYFLMALALFMCYLTSDYIKRHENKNILYLLLGTISFAFINIIINHYEIYQSLFLSRLIDDREIFMKFNEISNLIVFIIDLVAVVIALYGLFKAFPENKKSNKVIAFGVILITGMHIFLSTQSHISPIISYILGSINTLYMVCLICSLFIISINLKKRY